jgi:hypothetical protein
MTPPNAIEQKFEALIHDHQHWLLWQYLESLGWRREINYGGEAECSSPDREHQVTFDAGGWSLGKFTDADIDGVATGRYRTVDEGETIEELKIALAEIQAKPACIHCGKLLAQHGRFARCSGGETQFTPAALPSLEAL